MSLTNTSAFTTRLTLSGTYQCLATLLAADGIPLIGQAPQFDQPITIRNVDGSINVSVASGYTSAPSGTIGVLTPLTGITFNPGVNANEVWVKGASGTPAIDLFVGGIAYSSPLINGVIGSITGTNNTLPKYSSGSLVNSSLVDDGTNIAVGNSIVGAHAIVSTSPTYGIGYDTGAGGAVTQASNRTTGVTLNTTTGAITTNNTSLAAGAEASFTVTNSSVLAGDCVIVTARSGQTAATSIPFVTTVADGSFVITLSNFNASTADTGAMIINFAIIRAVSA